MNLKLILKNKNSGHLNYLKINGAEAMRQVLSAGILLKLIRKAKGAKELQP